METHTTALADALEAFGTEETPHETPGKWLTPITAEQREAGRLKRQAKIAEWGQGDTRQDFADERYLRSILSAAGVRSPVSVEPATESRMRLLLRRQGLNRAEVVETVGCSLVDFLKLNPHLPLWAALAMVLEATGKYDMQAKIIADAEADSSTENEGTQ